MRIGSVLPEEREDNVYHEIGTEASYQEDTNGGN